MVKLKSPEDAPRVLDLYEWTPELRREADKFKALLAESRNILISSTLTSDGDSIGAQLGIFHLCLALGKNPNEIWIVDHSPVPERYQFLHPSSKVITYSEWMANPKASSMTWDLGITLDGGIERTGDVKNLFERVKKRVLVDHHAVGSEMNYDSRLLDLSVSSTCELVFLLYEYFGIPVSAEIAESLYVGIVFDTGFFKHSLTKARTHLVAARLISTGIDFSRVADRSILERSWEAQLLLKQLLDNMESFERGRVIVSHWTKSELDQIQSKDGDQEGMINQLYYLDTAEVVILLTEKSDSETKLSFRSKGQLNVAQLARELDSGGGGHKRAAGCTLPLGLKEAKSLSLKVVSKALLSSAS